jgi:hypothetical protein
MKFLKSKAVLVLPIAVLIYLIAKAFSTGTDINVYLFASNQLFKGENIYDNNPFNNYLYSPLFALLLRPISIFEYPIARVLWAIFNALITYRLWIIASRLIKSNIRFDKVLFTQWATGVIFISLGFLNHNLVLGQISIVILWLTLEGLYQIIDQQKPIKGSLLLALGITIKIIPLIGLFYLFFKGKYKAVSISVIFIIIGLILPSVIIGHDYNMKMLNNWTDTINPTNNKYVFENNRGTQSLNAIIPAYFYDFETVKKAPANLKRQIASIPHNVLIIILQTLRVSLLLSLLLLIFHGYKQKTKKALSFYWQFSYLALLSALIFPHQQKYAMLYFVPAGSYMILHVLLVFKLKWNVSIKNKVIAVFASFLMFISAVMGRDIVGSYVVNIFDYYHGFGIINMIFLVLLLLVKPTLLVDLDNKVNNTLST